MSEARILIVEDEAIEALDLQGRLTHMGYPLPDVVHSGEDAVGKARETHPDLILMDIMLPGKMDGTEAAEQIRAFLDVPIMFLTAYADDKTLARAKITEPYAYTIKPFQEKELHIAIDMALYKHAAERKLKESEKRFSTTLRSIGDAVIATDGEGRITFMNPVAESLTAWKQEEAIGRKLAEIFKIINRDTRRPVEDPVAIVMRKGIVVGLANHTVLLTKNGAEIPIDDMASPIKDDRGNLVGVVLIFKDITERKKAEEALTKAKDELEIRVKERTRELALANEQLRQYSYRITQIQEEEKKRIAYELGEELAQTLAAIKMDADLMTKKVSSSLANVNSHVDSISEKMGTVLRTAINFSNALRPSVLGNLGLPEALEAIIAEMNRNGELEIVLKTTGAQRRLHDEIETTLFRIAQEALNNIIRHSGATKAKVNVGFLKTGTKLTIIDNGKGFDTEHKPGLTSKGAIGIIGMKERAHQIGGELEIKSELGKGTTITVAVPLQSN